jgi:hypothetical protein
LFRRWFASVQERDDRLERNPIANALGQNCFK